MGEAGNRITGEEFEAAKARAAALRAEAMRTLIDRLWAGMTRPMAEEPAHRDRQRVA
jgi:hypothetical protein